MNEDDLTLSAEPEAITDALPVDAEQPTAEPAAEAIEGEEQPAPKPKKTAQERFDELTRARREAERDAEYWKARALAAPQPQAAPEPQPQGGGEPDPAQYEAGEYDPRFIKDMIAFEAKRHAQAMLQDQQRQTAAQQRERTFQEGVKAAAEQHEDFHQVVFGGAERGAWVCTNEMLEAMMDAEGGAEIAYHLATNPAEAQRIAGLSPLAQAKEIGKLEAKLAAPPKPQPKIATTAPPPAPQARGSGGRFTVAPDTDDFRAFEKQYG